METDGYNKGYYNAYQKASDTVDQVAQIVMLYDGAINFIKQAKEAIIEKDYEKRYNLINKSVAIITGLNSCLNFTEESEETAKALDEFYSMIDMRLLYIQCDDSLESCDRVIEDLKRMRNAWADVATQTSEARFLQNKSDLSSSELEENSATALASDAYSGERVISQTDTSSLLETEIQINA